MKPEDWKQVWGLNNLVFLTESCDLLPAAAQDFLISYGMPRQIILENPSGWDWGDFDEEISFKDIAEPLAPLNADIRWGDFYDEEMDKALSQEIPIGHEEINQGGGAICVHRVSGIVTRIDDDDLLDLVIQINSSLPQYGECLFLAVQWSRMIHQTNLDEWKTSLQELYAAIERVDPEVVRNPHGEWYNLINRALEGKPGSLEITADPMRSRSRY